MIGAYSISKTAMLGLVKALAAECGPMGVRVNGIAPGVIETQMNEMVRFLWFCRYFLYNVSLF